MYRKFEKPLTPKFGRMYVSSEAKIDKAPPRQDDTITFRASKEVEFYVLVHEIQDGHVKGEITAIGPDPALEFEGWSHGDKIQIQEPYVTAIIRGD